MLMPATAQEVVDRDDQSAVADSAALNDVHQEGNGQDWVQTLRLNLDHLLASNMFKTSQVGMMVYDLTADSVLYAHNERQLMRPASTMKVITAITALDRLGGAHQFSTDLCYKGTIENNTLTGTIYCVGGFDPRFNSDDMRAFAESIHKMGVDTIRGKIIADKSMKDDKTYGEGWCWDDDNPTLSPLLISRTMDQVLLRMLKESDNLYAEAMFYQLAASSGARPATAKQARAIVMNLVRKLGLNPNSYRFADGSGLSLYNYVTAELEVAMLRYAYENSNIMLHLKPALPIAGTDGTIKSRMRGPFTNDNVRAKTGTLTGVSSLAGFCTAANGHQLAFSIINNGLRHTNNAHAFQDKVCTELCRPN